MLDLILNETRRFLLAGTVVSNALLIGGCSSQPSETQTRQLAQSVRNLVDAKADQLGTIDTNRFADVRQNFTDQELRLFYENFSEVESEVNHRLADDSIGAVWIAGYFRIESSLPFIKQILLHDRYFYGWEGPDYSKEWAYLDDEQYIDSLACIAAIEAIAGKPLRESITLTPAELATLKEEANVDFEKGSPIPGRVELAESAKWLLSKLTLPGPRLGQN